MLDDAGNRGLSIALRRTPRRSAAAARVQADAAASSSRGSRHRSAASTPVTPSDARRARGKRPRPSEADSIVVGDVDEPTTPSRRAIPSTKRRRRHTNTPGASQDDRTTNTLGSTEIRIFPLRAILDDRVKRRIRRNGLSEEMNVIFDEKRSRARKTVEEMTRLRDQLAAKEAENERLREESSLLQEASRIEELEREIASLRHGLHSGETTMVEEKHLHYDDWDMGAADGFTDHGSILDGDDHFRDDTTVELESASTPVNSTPVLAKSHVVGRATLTPPITSPAKPATPDFSRHVLSASNCDAGVQAFFEDPGKTSLETELADLRCEILSLNKALEDQGQLESQLRAKLSAAEGPNVDPDIQLQMDIMVQTLADKTAALTDLNASLASLGPSSDADASKTVSALKDAFQSARQELEQLFPEEGPLPLSCQGVSVLDTVLQHLREAARSVKEHGASLDEHRAREDSLRQQLDDRAGVLEEMGRKLRAKDDRIFQLEDDVDRLRGAVEGYQGSLAELEALVQQMEAANRDFEANLAAERAGGQRALEARDAQLAEMEARLGAMISVTADLRGQLAEAHVGSETDLAAAAAAHDEALARRDARLAELEAEVARLREALGQAHASVAQLRADKGRLQGDAEREKKAARDTVAMLRTQLLQTLQMSEAFLAPAAPTGEPEESQSAGLAAAEQPSF